MGTEIKSLSGCSIAAKYLNLEDTNATSDGQHSEYYSMSNHPPFCYYEGNELKFNEGSNSGECTDSDLCLCAGSGGFAIHKNAHLRLFRYMLICMIVTYLLDAE